MTLDIAGPTSFNAIMLAVDRAATYQDAIVTVDPNEFLRLVISGPGKRQFDAKEVLPAALEVWGTQGIIRIIARPPPLAAS